MNLSETLLSFKAYCAVNYKEKTSQCEKKFIQKMDMHCQNIQEEDTVHSAQYVTCGYVTILKYN